jgi:SWI/SNF-related matrix-associated actin-dependent regulator of chromatin subfamily A member 5
MEQAQAIANADSSMVIDLDEVIELSSVDNEAFETSFEDDDIQILDIDNEETTATRSHARISNQRSIIPRSTIEEGNQTRLVSLSRHRHVLQPFITDKVSNQLKSCQEQSKLMISQSRFRILDDSSVTILHKQPTTIVNCIMRQYQLEGLNWLIQQYDQRINSILGDEMGLGKTLQSIAFTAHILHVKKLAGPFLFVVPLTVMFNWLNEFKKYCPSIRVLRMHSNDAKEQLSLIANMKGLSRYDAVVTTYEAIKQGGMSQALKRQVWRGLFLDEGHRIRNEETQVSKSCMALSAVFKVVLSGTPLQNNLREAGAILKFLAPNVFVDLSFFNGAFNLSERVIDRDLLNKAHYMMRPFLLRRIKAEVEQKLPPKLETKINCPMTQMQKELTQFLLFRERGTLERLDGMKNSKTSMAIDGVSRASDRTVLMGLLAHLRKAANHPYLFEGMEDVTDPLGRASHDIIDVSGKMRMLDRLLSKLKENGHRVVLFSQFVKMLDIICDYLEFRGYKYRRLDGSTNRVMREVQVSLFSRRNSEDFIFCLSTRAGGEGVNLVSADTVILFDSDWNPQVDIQAMARVHRIGQTKPVHIYRLVASNSVEEMIVHRAQKKLFLDSMVNRGSSAKGRALDVNAEDGGSDEEDADIQLSKRARASASDEDEELQNIASLGEKEDVEGAANPSKIFEVLKFGWQSVFVSKADDETADHDLKDEEIDDLIDRKRGLDGLEKPSPVTSSFQNPQTAVDNSTSPITIKKRKHDDVSTGKGTESAHLQENQEQNVLNYNESEPLASIDSLRYKYFADFESKLKNSSILGGNESLEVSRPAMPASDDQVDAHGRNKRVRETRTQTVHVDGIGEVQMLRQQDLRSLAPYGHRKEVGFSDTNKLIKEFVMYLRDKNEKELNVVSEDGSNNNQKEQPNTSTRPTTKPGFIVLEGKARQVAGRDFLHEDFCQVCWDGGSLICCDLCPCSYHAVCLGYSEDTDFKRFHCPHHNCSTCGRTSSAAGCLFRCEICQYAYCDDCLPPESEIVGECQRFIELGYRRPSSAYYIRCSVECQQHDPDKYFDAEDEIIGESESAMDADQESDHSEDESLQSLSDEDETMNHQRSSHKTKERQGRKDEKSQREGEEKSFLKPDSSRKGDLIIPAATEQADSVNIDPATKSFKNRFDLTLALENCTLNDIRQRLSLDEKNISARFINLMEVPNIIMRFQRASSVAKAALQNLLLFVSEQNRKDGDDTVSNSTNSASAVPSNLEQAEQENQDGEYALFSQFSGIHPSKSTQFKADTFFKTLKFMAPLQRNTLPQIGQILGICTPSFIRRFQSQLPAKLAQHMAEPRFTFNISNSTARNMLEECIASFLVVLSPFNLLMHNSKEKSLQSSISYRYEVPVEIPRRSSVSSSISNNNIIEQREVNDAKMEDIINAIESTTASSEIDENEKKAEMKVITVTKRFDGLFLTTRLLQSLGECMMDENRQFFTAVALRGLDLPGLQRYRSDQVPTPASPSQKLLWIWPIIRIFRRILSYDSLLRMFLPPKNQSQYTRTLLPIIRCRPEYEQLLDIDSTNLKLYLIQGVQVLLGIRIYELRLRRSEESLREEAASPKMDAMQLWLSEKEYALDVTSFRPTLAILSQVTPNLATLISRPQKQVPISDPAPSKASGKTSETTVSNPAAPTSRKESISSVAYCVLSCRLEFAAWLASSRSSSAHLISAVCEIPSELELTPSQSELVYMLIWLCQNFGLLQKLNMSVEALCKSLNLEKVIPLVHAQVGNSTKQPAASESSGENVSKTDPNLWRINLSVQTRNAVIVELYQMFQQLNGIIDSNRQRVARNKTVELSLTYNPLRALNLPTPILFVPLLDELPIRLQVYELAILCLAVNAKLYADNLLNNVLSCLSKFFHFISNQSNPKPKPMPQPQSQLQPQRQQSYHQGQTQTPGQFQFRQSQAEIAKPLSKSSIQQQQPSGNAPIQGGNLPPIQSLDMQSQSMNYPKAPSGTFLTPVEMQSQQSLPSFTCNSTTGVQQWPQQPMLLQQQQNQSRQLQHPSQQQQPQLQPFQMPYPYQHFQSGQQLEQQQLQQQPLMIQQQHQQFQQKREQLLQQLQQQSQPLQMQLRQPQHLQQLQQPQLQLQQTQHLQQLQQPQHLQKLQQPRQHLLLQQRQQKQQKQQQPIQQRQQQPQQQQATQTSYLDSQPTQGLQQVHK